MTDRFLVVGGDAAGMSAAAKAKRDNPEMDVIVFERDDWVSYGACGLPYYVKGEIATLGDLVVMDPRKAIEERGIDIRRRHEVVDVDRTRQTVTVEDEGDRYTEAYDDLLLATGAVSTVPDIPGHTLDGVFSIRSLRAGRALKDYIAPHETPSALVHDTGYNEELSDHFERADPNTACIVGANKIGIELAEAFIDRGMSVHIIEDGPRPLPAFGADIAEMVVDHLRESGVELHFETRLEAIRGADGQVTAVETDAGAIPTETVIFDLDIDPEVQLATAAGIECGPTGAIATDEFGRTNDPDVFAAGDCAEKRHRLTGEPVQWPFALAANRAGRAVGRTVAGTPTPVGDIVGTLVMKAMDLQVARSGIVNHDRARAAGFDPVSATITTISRAHYYPGWSRIVVHATADNTTGRLLGANMVGEEGTAHRINSVATALSAEMTIADVGQLDFGYAPPFGPVWDPVLGVAKVLAEKVR